MSLRALLTAALVAMPAAAITKMTKSVRAKARTKAKSTTGASSGGGETKNGTCSD